MLGARCCLCQCRLRKTFTADKICSLCGYLVPAFGDSLEGVGTVQCPLWSAGDKYDGPFKEGKAHGEGLYIVQNGKTYSSHANTTK